MKVFTLEREPEINSILQATVFFIICKELSSRWNKERKDVDQERNFYDLKRVVDNLE